MKSLRKTKLRLKDMFSLTLIDFLIVVAVIGIMAALFIPLYNNLKWIQ